MTPLWSEITEDAEVGDSVAVTFYEREHKQKDNRSISFDGEYRAIAKGKTMTGPWFSGKSLVGRLNLECQQVYAERQPPSRS
jgi:hypothetical protein